LADPQKESFSATCPTRGSRARNLTEVAQNIAGDRTELRVIENVEVLCPEFQIRFFCDRRSLVEREVRVVYAGTVEETTVGIAEHAWAFGGEGGCIEPLSSFSDVKETDRLAIVVLNIGSLTPVLLKASLGSEKCSSIEFPDHS
jgi:hypothetical protein